jgi:SAM-dependent methyltransferase
MLSKIEKDHDPQIQVSAGNAWYNEDQFDKQYRRPGPRAVIENRWRIFEVAIEDFLNTVEVQSQFEPVRILDAGCGDGINLLGLSKIVHLRGWNVRIYGADYNPLRVDRASKLPFIEEVKLSPLDSLPYPNGYFQVVLCNQVLEHISNDLDVLVEFKRILQPGGMLILGVPNEGCALAWFRNHVLQRSILRTTDHVNFYTKNKISDLVSTTQMELYGIVSTGFFIPHLLIHYMLSCFAIGRSLMRLMGEIWPSQCVELIVLAKNSEF